MVVPLLCLVGIKKYIEDTAKKTPKETIQEAENKVEEEQETNQEEVEEGNFRKVPTLSMEQQLELIASGVIMHPSVTGEALNLARASVLIRYTGLRKEQVDEADADILRYICLYWNYTFNPEDTKLQV